MTTFTNTRAALVVYDAQQPARTARWTTVDTEEGIWALDAEEKAALVVLQEAFHKDTAHINSREHCALVDVKFMRQMASRSEPHTIREPRPLDVGRPAHWSR